MGGQQALLSYAMKDTLRQQYEEMQSQFDEIKAKVAAFEWIYLKN